MTNTFAWEYWHISIALLQNLIKNFEFNYALDIWLDHITFEMFHIFERMSLNLMWVLFFPFFFIWIVVLVNFIILFDMFLGVFDWTVEKIEFEFFF